MICSNCKNQIASSTSFCPHCGHRNLVKPAPIPKGCPVCGKPTSSNYPYCVQCGCKLNQSKQTVKPVVKYVPVKTNHSEVISAWGYFGYSLLFSIPIAGFIIMIIMACTADNENLRNYAKSFIIRLVFVVIFVLVFVVGCGGCLALMLS